VSTVALDTSVAVPLLVRSHTSHAAVRAALGRRAAVLTGHSQAETYSVLTRLPGDARVAPVDAARLIEANFGPAVVLDPATVAGLPRVLAAIGLAGGAVYDALVALAARQQAVPLATRDARALGTYAAVGAEVEVIGS
jgi:predicted nucleic acid-binding protein